MIREKLRFFYRFNVDRDHDAITFVTFFRMESERPVDGRKWNPIKDLNHAAIKVPIIVFTISPFPPPLSPLSRDINHRYTRKLFTQMS